MVWVILCLMVDMIFLQRRFWRAHGWRALCWLAHGFVIAFATADCLPGGLSVVCRWSVGGVSVVCRWRGSEFRHVLVLRLD